MDVVIFGAGGYSREVADVVVAAGYTIAAFQDDFAEGPHIPTGLPVIRIPDSSICKQAVCAIGDVQARANCWHSWVKELEFITLIHPSACVSRYSAIGAGSQVMQNVVVNAQARVGVNVILNVGCVVAHDVSVGAHTHIAPGVLLSGASTVGTRTLVGAGAVLLPGIHVGSDCVIGAGAVVTRNIPDNSKVFGVPAR
ncbi:MAG: acetyltransferase [Actinobacteria bacterium]|nr:acetyltransferase [Actinomycetota bacterium]MCL5887889.1 acetyltransferase [Actinomycetota bacterium]